MRFPCTIEETAVGEWRMRYQGPELGTVEARAGSREEVIRKMRGELRYRLELCPCSGESYQHIEIELTRLG